ncbi:MAG: DNA polymerase IV [Acidimicrobiia bacterium]|nr:DNA polymerase IV [Acidimicrobiia bacterium]MDH5420302.1 DNA polymerase IV [Acidimicrobiia bacterium]MDH5503763.1 DNA polymerase IV [Acidimicrobiia bacterium]
MARIGKETRSEATILHADLDAFYASVEQRDNPELRGKPILVGGGVILAASYEAKRFGVKTAMSERKAKELCPQAIVVHPRFSAYTEASRAVFDVFDDTSPIVEGLSIDEAFIDVGGLGKIAGSPERIAAWLRAEVKDRVGLNITVGVARTKFLAKVASAVAKPDGLLVVDPSKETEFLYPLPVQALWGVGKVTAEKLNDCGLYTVGDVAAVRPDTLVSFLGKASGRHLYSLAHHQDPRRVETGKRRGSVGSQQALGRSKKTPDELESLLLGIVDRVMRRLRTGHRIGRTVVLRMRFDDFTRATRSRSLRWPTGTTEPVAAVALALLREAQPTIRAKGGLTLIGMSIANLSDDRVVQLTFPLASLRQRGELDHALDDLRDRFGNRAITRASLLGRNTGFEVPKLPD